MIFYLQRAYLETRVRVRSGQRLAGRATPTPVLLSSKETTIMR